MAFRALFVVAMFAAVALAAEQNDGVWDVNACTFSYVWPVGTTLQRGG